MKLLNIALLTAFLSTQSNAFMKGMFSWADDEEDD